MSKHIQSVDYDEFLENPRKAMRESDLPVEIVDKSGRRRGYFGEVTIDPLIYCPYCKADVDPPNYIDGRLNMTCCECELTFRVCVNKIEQASHKGET